MKIGIEAERANLPQKTGVEVYAAQLISHLARLDDKNEYILYFRTTPAEWFYKLPANFKLRVIPFPKFWTQLRISFEMLTHKVDALIILASALPFVHPKKSVVTVHDVAWKMFPEAFTPFMRKYLEWSTWYALKHAKKIVAVSQSTKNDVVKFYAADPSKIEVVYLGFDKARFKVRPYGEVQPILDKWKLAFQKYILFVGTLQPRKNIIKLIEAYVLLKQRHRIEEKLVIVGKKGWLWEPILRKMKDYENLGIVHLDFSSVTDEDLPYLYNGASVFALTSLYEGFGLPPLEAMASGAPVVVANVSSLPEVVGDAGTLVDPKSEFDIASAILNILQDKTLRGQLIAKGLLQAEKFSWENTAKQTLKLFESL